MLKSLIAGIVIAASGLAATAPLSAQVGQRTPALKSPTPVMIDVQYRQYPYGPRRYNHRRQGVQAGVGIAAGLAAGAIIGGALSAAARPPGYGRPVYDPADVDYPQGPQVADADEYCASRYRSYDPSMGTYLGYDGERHSCPE